MKLNLFAMPIFLASSLTAFAQVPESTPTDQEKSKPQIAAKSEKEKSKEDSQNQLNGTGYVRPDADKRFKRYLKGVVGPVSLLRSAATAGVTTARNSPSEWGGQWEGFGRRFASNVGKTAIKNTTIYGLDEALKVDSHFYRSKNRGVKSRLYNAVISPVTARKPNGKRVLGVPRIAGSFASSLIASTTWYPERFGAGHGIKGGAISLGFNAAFNLFKEFVWKK
jgi:hypothetical protein